MLYSVQMKVTWLLWQQMWCALLEENVPVDSTIRHAHNYSALLKDRNQYRSKLVLCTATYATDCSETEEGWWQYTGAEKRRF